MVEWDVVAAILICMSDIKNEAWFRR